MIRLYIGGAWQGQDDLACRENPDSEMYQNFHEIVWRAVQEGEDPVLFTRRFCRAHPDAVIVADEVGYGIVPVEKEARAYREAVGRALCEAAAQAAHVTRVVCGIGMILK